MKLQPVLRHARPSDERELLRLIRAYYRFDHIRFDPNTTRWALHALLRDHRLGRVWVAEGERTLQGYVVLTFNYDLEFGGMEGMITELYVDARRRGSGIGHGLIEAARSFCADEGISTLELQVSKKNRDARMFYKSLGFREFDRIVMALDVTPVS